jgi:outer membrane protein assembly factor BamB
MAPAAGQPGARTGVNIAAPAGRGGRTASVSTGITGGRTAALAVQASGAGGRTPVGGADINRTVRGASTVGGPRLLWDFQTNLRIAERPILGEKTVLIVSSGRDVLFLNKADGDKPLAITADAPVSAPVGQYGETAYVPCQDGSVYALHLPTRVALWHFTADGPIVEEPQATDEDLYVTAARGGVSRLNRATGDQVWRNPTAVRFLAVNPKFVYAVDRLGRLIVLDRALGTTLTVLDTKDYVVEVRNENTDRVLLGANDGTLISLHDKAYPTPLRLQTGEPAAPPAEAPKSPGEPMAETPPAGNPPATEKP